MTTLFVKNYIKLLIISFLFFYPATSYCKKTYEEKRESMVEWQIKNRGVKDKAVLNAMRTVPRHLFVPELYRSTSYADRPLPIGTTMRPPIVNWSSNSSGISGGAAVTTIASKDAAPRQP